MTQRSFKIIYNKRNIVRDRISCELRRESNPGLLLFCFTTLFDWLRKLALPYSQSDAKLKPAATCSRVFPALLSFCLFFAVSCNEPLVFFLFFFFSFALSGHCDYFGLGLRESKCVRNTRKIVLTRIIVISVRRHYPIRPLWTKTDCKYWSNWSKLVFV